MIDCIEGMIGDTYLVVRDGSVYDEVIEMTILGFSDSEEYFKYKAIDGRMWWAATKDYTIIDSVSYKHKTNEKE